MKAIKKIVRIGKEREIKIQIPPFVAENQLIEVILIIEEEETKKIDELKQAMSDKLFLEDLREIEQDFQYIDSEGL